MCLAYKDTNILFKILPCLLIAIFFVMIFSSSCFASITTIVDGEEFIVSDETLSLYPYYLLVGYSDGSYQLIVSTSPITCGTVIDGRDTYHAYYGSNMQYIFGGFSSVNNFKKFSPTYSGISVVKHTTDSGDRSVKSANHDIYDSDGNLVFQGAPQEEVNPVELAPLMTSIEFSEVMAEVLAILPILLVVVIGLLALRKAIQLLFKMLRKA